MNENAILKVTNDYIFKSLFSKKGNEDILKDLLEGILEIRIEKIEVMQEVELNRVDIKDKLGILDIKAIINEDTTIDIEIQVSNEKNMIERTLFYWSGLYYTGLKKGKRYEENNKVITINILRYNIFKGAKYHTIGLIKEKNDNKEITDKLEIHFIELPKFLKSKEQGNKKLRQWLEFICNERKEEISVAVRENEKIAKANSEWEYLKGDEAVKRLAFLREKWIRDYDSGVKNAEEEGIAIGEKRGKKIGEARGKEIGEKKGREEIAIKMIKKKMDENLISEVTNLTITEIEKIKQKLEKQNVI